LKLGDTLKSSHLSKSPPAIITDRTKITEQDFYWVSEVYMNVV
jgi:hypothetical protein